jgi:hypothetical protein
MPCINFFHYFLENFLQNMDYTLPIHSNFDP